MTYMKYPDEATVNGYIAKREPLIIAISFDGETVLMSHNEDSFEHHILLAHFGVKQTDIDRYFRIVVDHKTAEWTFVCPHDYHGITDRQRRIKRFYNDGISAISRVLSDIGYFSDIIIPQRYRRHSSLAQKITSSISWHTHIAPNRAMLDDSTYLPY